MPTVRQGKRVATRMRRPRATAGIALISVLWTLALLSVIAAGVGSVARGETRLVGNLVALTQARSAAEGGVALAVSGLLLTAPGERWPADGQFRDATLAGIALRIAITDESGKIDVNSAPPATLERLLTAAGVGDGRRASLVDAIADWRDSDNLRRLNGAEGDDYAAAGLAYTPRDGRFGTLDELRLVLGMDADLYERLASALTIHTGRASANLAVAPPLVREALGAGGVAQANDQGATPTYSIDVRAVAESGVAARVVATVMLTPGTGAGPFRVVAWKEAGADTSPDANVPNDDRLQRAAGRTNDG